MRTRKLPLILLSVLLSVLCSSVQFAAAAPASSALTATQINQAIDAHNAVRRRVALAESKRLGGTVSIPDVTWNANVASLAQAWADHLISLNPQSFRIVRTSGRRALVKTSGILSIQSATYLIRQPLRQ